jgi:hypothetical protein
MEQPDLLRELFPDYEGQVQDQVALPLGPSGQAVSGPAAPSKPSPERALAGLRGVLIVWVMAEHWMSDNSPYGRRLSLNTSFFVMLSGFSTYLATSQLPYDWAAWEPFLRSRLVGIFPLLILSMVLWLPWYLHVREVPGTHFQVGKNVYLYSEVYSSWRPYVVDFVLMLSGMQAFSVRVERRAFRDLYYARYASFLNFPASWPRLSINPPVRQCAMESVPRILLLFILLCSALATRGTAALGPTYPSACLHCRVPDRDAWAIPMDRWPHPTPRDPQDESVDS